MAAPAPSVPLDRLTPRTLALAHLVDLYITDDTLPVGSRHELTCLLLYLVTGSGGARSVIEPPLSALLAQLERMPRAFVTRFTARIRAMTEPDDLWQLAATLGEFVEPNQLAVPIDDTCGAPLRLERSSALGLFVRRFLLASERLTFEALCTLTAHFAAWVAAPTDPAAEPTADPAAADPAAPVDDPAFPPLPSRPPPPPWAHALPRSQLDRHIGALIASYERGVPLADGEAAAGATFARAGAGTPFWWARSADERAAAAAAAAAADGLGQPVPDCREQLDELRRHAPPSPPAHYLQLQHHLRARIVEPSVESLHRYFDSANAAAAATAPPAGPNAAADRRRSEMQWADLNLARLHLSFGHRQLALQAIYEAMRSAQQNEDNVCLAHALLWLAHVHDGACAEDAFDEATDSTLAQGSAPAKSLLQRCLARAHELQLPELAALASEALAMRCTLSSASAGPPEPHNPPALPQPTLSAGQSPCLPAPSLQLPAALPSMPPDQPPPLHAWDALRCGADGNGASANLVRACAWERFGEMRLAALHASLQLRLYAPSLRHSLTDGSIPTEFDRVAAACKLASLRAPQLGEAAALRLMLAVRERCYTGPSRATWLLHLAEILLRGMLLRQETRAAAELVEQYKTVLEMVDGPSDATWHAELEIKLQRGYGFEALHGAYEKLDKARAYGRGAGASSTRPMLMLIKARAQYMGGEPIRALPHALRAMAHTEKEGLRGVYSAATLQFAEVHLELDAGRALSHVERIRAFVTQAPTTIDRTSRRTPATSRDRCRPPSSPPAPRARRTGRPTTWRASSSSPPSATWPCSRHTARPARRRPRCRRSSGTSCLHSPTRSAAISSCAASPRRVKCSTTARASTTRST